MINNIKGNYMLCDYGCGLESKFLMSSGKNCCSERYNSCPALRKKNAEGLEAAHADGRCKPPPLVSRSNGKGVLRENEETFTYNGRGNHKGLLIKERGHECEVCKNTEWQDNPIPLELEHTDGDNKNNTKENLKLLCCNCHALTPTWRGRNVGVKNRVADNILINALEASVNIKEALLSVGLVAKGGNYIRCRKLINSGVKLKTVPKTEIKLDKTNSQFGKIWICHLDNKENKKISPDELLHYMSVGWLKGRVTKFGQVAQLVETR
jgi:hypothetical protein